MNLVLLAIPFAIGLYIGVFLDPELGGNMLAGSAVVTATWLVASRR